MQWSSLGLEPFRHLAVDDALGQPLDDGGLAHAGLADQDWVVLGAPGEHLDGAPNLVVAADDGVEFALFGLLREVDAEALQGLALLLGIGVVHRPAAADLFDGALDGALAGAGLAHQFAERARVLGRREHEELRGYELVVALLRQLVCLVQETPELVGDMDVARGPLDLGQALQRLAEARAQPVDVDVGHGQQLARGPAFLVQERHHQVDRLDELVIASHGQALGVRQRQLEFAGHLVHSHWTFS